jgi:hypothetical protein
MKTTTLGPIKTFALFLGLFWMVGAGPVYAQLSMAHVRSQLHNEMSPEDVFNLRQQIVQARYEEDQNYLHGQRQYIVNKDIFKELRSGDILLARSKSLIGSLAARASEVPGQFSHLIFIARDPFTKELKQIESDQGAGVVISKVTSSSLMHWVRIGLFRYHNPKVAKAAAESFLAQAQRRLKMGPIQYDNRMDLNDNSTVYCTEIVTWAFKLVGVQVPQWPSEIRFLNATARKNLGIKTDRVFTPQDLEVDPRFVLVKEWRNPEDLQGIYRSDAIFGRYFVWLREGKEHLNPGLLSKIASTLGKTLFASTVADRLGEDVSDKRRLSNLIRYGFTMYMTLSNYEAALKKELYYVDTSYFTVADYEDVLERLRLENRLQGQSSQAENMYYGR